MALGVPNPTSELATPRSYPGRRRSSSGRHRLWFGAARGSGPLFEHDRSFCGVNRTEADKIQFSVEIYRRVQQGRLREPSSIEFTDIPDDAYDGDGSPPDLDELELPDLLLKDGPVRERLLDVLTGLRNPPKVATISQFADCDLETARDYLE